MEMDDWEGGIDESESTDESEDISENDEQFTEIKEQMYQDKLANLKRQLKELSEGVLPEYVKKLRRLESNYKERKRINVAIRELELEFVEQDFLNEESAAAREFSDAKVYLKEQLILELEEKQKIIETERHNMELTGDSMDLKPISTRKLRRRANESSGTGSGNGNSSLAMGSNSVDKRRKTNSLQYLLEESEILHDLGIVNKNKSLSNFVQSSEYGSEHFNSYSGNNNNTNNASNTSNNTNTTNNHIRIEDGKLFYEKRWFRRGQAVQVETETEKYPAMISAIGSEAIWVRKSSDNSKVRIYTSQLSKGKFVLKRRAV